MTTDRPYLLLLLTRALGSEALAEEVMEIVETAGICPRCGSALPMELEESCREAT